MARSEVAQTRDLRALQGLINKALSDYLDSATTNAKSCEAARTTAIRACEKVAALLYNPFEWLFAESASYILPAALSVAIELKLHHYVSSDAKSPTHVEDLAIAAGTSPVLIRRILRILTKRFIFEEVKPSHYIHSQASSLLMTPSVEAWVALSTDDNLRAAASFLPLLQENKFKIPEKDNECAFSKAFQTPQNQFEYYFANDVKRGQRAALSMAAFNATSMFKDFPFPFHELPAGSLVVDIGGGGGHVSANIARTHSHLKFVVQDMGEALEMGKKNKEFADLPIEWHEQSLFSPQEIKGAEVYMIRHVLHGFPDPIAAQILRNVVGAMIPGKSRILIIDCVVPEAFGSDSFPFVNATDMLAFLGGNGKQRTAQEWAELAKLADDRLEVVEVWNQEENLASADAVVEIKLR